METGDIYICTSSDEKILESGENGGVVTSLLKYVLERKLVDMVLTVRQGKNRYEGILSFTSDPNEVTKSAGSLHFATPIIAKNIKKYLNTDKRVAVVCKSCDARAIIELARINQITIENFLLIGLNCSGTLSPVPHMQMIRELGFDPYTLIYEDIDDDKLILRFKDGSEKKLNLEELEKEGLGRRANCQRCDYPIPRMADLACGRWGTEDGKETFIEVCSLKGKELLETAVVEGIVSVSPASQEQNEWRKKKEKEKIEAARRKQNSDFEKPEDKLYWFSQFENCIKCYGCRDACPLCHCNRCVLERDEPETVKKGVIPPPQTFGMIRAFHIACYCVNCGQCEDVCSADIPISRLMHYLNNTISRVFGYESGTDVSTPLPLSTIPQQEREITGINLS